MGDPVADLAGPWRSGVRPGSGGGEPPLEARWYDDSTLVLRQSKTVTAEAPFLFLLLGSRRALLLDTGDVADPLVMPLRGTIEALVSQWLDGRAADEAAGAGARADAGRDDYELVVAHTHGHGDHVAGDAQFRDRPATVVVGHQPGEVAAFFGFPTWPGQTTFDLGDRVLEILAIPGHHAASIAVYDRATTLLLTGDTVYPGRLYVEDFPAYLDSLDRLVAFARTHPVAAVVGCHVEMTVRPGQDYPLGTRYQPAEHPLPMTVAQLEAVRDAAHRVADRPGAHTFDDFVIYHGPCRAALARQVLRRLASTARQRRPTRP